MRSVRHNGREELTLLELVLRLHGDQDFSAGRVATPDR
jgi:hypothetical protein